MIDFKAKLAAAKLAKETPITLDEPGSQPIVEVAAPVVAQPTLSFKEKMQAAKDARLALEAGATAALVALDAPAQSAPVAIAKPKLPAFLQKLADKESTPEPLPKPLAPTTKPVGSFLAILKAKAAATSLPNAITKPDPSPPVQPEPPKMTAEAGLTFLQKMRAMKQVDTEVRQELAVTAPDAEEPSEYDFGEIVLNERQAMAPKLAAEGQSFVLTGAAGTGKTTAQAAVVESLDKSGAFGVHDFKYIGEAPSIALIAFTKVAVRNIQKALRKNHTIARYAHHCMTLHALLEFQPVMEERMDDEGETKVVRIFRPQRTASNPLKLTHLIVEEASMLGTDLWALLMDALPEGVQIIFLGDINQLKPVFGDPILAYALKQLPVIELVEVYRNAGPIILEAHKVLKGLPFGNTEGGEVSILSGKSKFKVTQAAMGRAMGAAFQKLYEAGEYDPDLDIILCPWNKREMGTMAINEGLATYLGNKRGALVQEVRAGFNRWWLAEGDKLLVDKRQGYIVNIQTNPKYVGQTCMPAGSYTRSGIPILSDGSQGKADDGAGWDEMADYSNFSLSDIDNEEDSSRRASSHIVTVRFNDQEEDDFTIHEVSTSGEFSPAVFQFGYALTVHKSQGSEWRNVYLMAHYDHMGFLCRELIYTALTRAAESFTFFGKEDLLAKAVSKVSIKGDTLADKIEYFSSGMNYDETVRVTKPRSDTP